MRTNQIARWLRFCEKDVRSSLPAEEGDVLAYIGYLSLNGRIAPESLPRYLSAISQYSEFYHLDFLGKTLLVRALVRPYRRKHEIPSRDGNVRIGLRALTMRRLVAADAIATDSY